MDQTENKKKNPIGIVILIVAIILIIIGIVLNFKNETGLTKKKNTTNKNGGTTNAEKVDYQGYTEEYPKDKRTIDYYYNIYTPAFDKSKYNGKISLFGIIVNGPLTIQNLSTYNITYANNLETMKIFHDEGAEKEYRGIDLNLDGTKYPVSSISPSVYLINETSGEIFFEQSTTSKDTKNIIVPYLNNVDLNNLSVDDLIDNLGVPTYVGGRTTKLENAEVGFLLVYSYVYDYGDDTFEFIIGYSENTGNVITNFIYRGKEFFNGKMSELDKKTGEMSYYNGYKDYYEKQYKLYQEDLKR